MQYHVISTVSVGGMRVDVGDMYSFTGWSVQFNYIGGQCRVSLSDYRYLTSVGESDLPPGTSICIVPLNQPFPVSIYFKKQHFQ